MLSAQQLELTFNPGTPIEMRALRGMSLDIPTGQFVTVIGSNGAGKSTFLNAISGDQSVNPSTAWTSRASRSGRARSAWRGCFKTRWPAPAKT